MADLFSQLYPLPKPDLKHLFLRAEPRRIDYQGPRARGKKLRDVERLAHADLLNRELDEIAGHARELQEQIKKNQLPEFEGLVLKVDSAPGFPLSSSQIDALLTKTGEPAAGNITLLNAYQVKDDDGNPYTRVILNVPFGCISYLQEKVRIFAEGEGTTDQAFIRNISDIAEAAIDFLWTDSSSDLPRGDVSAWWQLWVLKSPESAQGRFVSLADQLNIRLRSHVQDLPERYVYVAHTSYETLAASPALLDTLGEIRGAYPLRHDYMDLSALEQREYVREAERRIRLPGKEAPYVCILDTGVNRTHPLLENLLELEDSSTVFGDGLHSDAYIHFNVHGHGTPMAGLAAFGDLRSLLEQTDEWEQTHRLESVRIFDPARPHEPDNYGKITEQAISLPETKRNTEKRVYCLAITARGIDDGRPSAWSASVDAAAYGADATDAPKRLIVVSAGDVDPLKIKNYQYPNDNRFSRIEDPAQAWNAVTVGAITHRIATTEPDDESKRLHRIAPAGGISPFSRTSYDWNDHWPIKPDIVLEGGNAATHPEHGIEVRESLELTTTSGMARMGRELCSFNATSAATALAARMLAQIYDRYANIWPETARGLLVHSARWNETMLHGIDPHSRYKRDDRRRFKEMLRVYGYGEPNVDRCHFSAQHAVTMIREDALQPYLKRNGSIQLNDCHIHTIPLPQDLLRENSDMTLTLRVTLSYFTAPNPTANNALGSSRYRYGGALLRFMVRHKDDSVETFNARLERAAEKEEDEDSGDADDARKANSDPGWALGSQLRGKGGSLLHDVWQGSAADLLTMDRIAIFPRKGWWSGRQFSEDHPWHKAYERPVRYSLLVSIESNQDVPIYQSIQNILEAEIEAEAT